MYETARFSLQIPKIVKVKSKQSKFYISVVMAAFREVRENLLLAYDDDIINDEEFLLLYDINTSKNLDFPYEQYGPFDLDKLSDDECLANFRFFKNDIYTLSEVMDMPDEFHTYNRVKVEKIEALCIFLRRVAYPCRYSDIIPHFGRPVPQLSMISNLVMDFVFQNYRRLLQDFNQPWLSPANLRAFADSIHAAGAPLDNCWGFIDGTVRPICRPNVNQKIVYNGHKRLHGIKFQSVVAANGLIAHMDGPYEGRKHDSGMLAESGLLPLLNTYSHDPAGNQLCIYGDPAYPLRIHLQAPFRGPGLTHIQKQYNKAMSRVRVSVEWVFGDIVNYFAFVDFKKNLKIGLSSIGKMYLVCGIIRNAHTCLYHSVATKYFGMEPPSLQDYFQ